MSVFKSSSSFYFSSDPHVSLLGQKSQEQTYLDDRQEHNDLDKRQEHTHEEEKIDFEGGNVHVITSKEDWDQKMADANKDGKIVSKPTPALVFILRVSSR